MKNQYSGLKRIVFAFKNSFEGLISAFKREEAFRQDIFISIILFIFSCYLSISVVERILLITSVLFVLFAELVNTAIESVVDRISSEWHLLSKIAKDVGSSLVFISFINLIITWFLICKKFF